MSEQISTAGFEASGTGNMKFSLNGALTIGTLDGANIEIMEEVEVDNIFIFGLSADEIKKRRITGYNPWDYYNQNYALKRVLDFLASDKLCGHGESALFQPIVDSLLNNGDYYYHLADFETYAETQEQVASLYQQQENWATKAILNVARMGKFSSDRTIQEYASEIWNAKPILD